MTDAAELVDAIRKELQPLHEHIIQHPYLEALEQGSIPRGNIALFVGEQHRIIESDLRSIALLISRCSMPRTRRYLQELLNGEDAAFGALHNLANALELNEGWLQAYPPTPEAQSYTHFLSYIAVSGSPAELAGAFLLNLPAWGANCRRMAVALQSRYGIAQDAVTFLDFFAEPQPNVEQTILRVIQQGLDTGVEARHISTTARFLQSYELAFWDSLLGASA
jgi:pyrroloquinoline quinone (PQQ) biosynthesis protein C